MKKSRSQIACPDSGSGFILGESDKSSIFLKTGFRFLRAGPAWDLSEAAVRRSWSFRPNCYLSFSANYCFSTIFFSTPPGYVRTKKVLHTFNPANPLLAPGVGFGSQLQIPVCLRTCSGDSFSRACGRDANRLTKIPSRRAC